MKKLTAPLTAALVALTVVAAFVFSFNAGVAHAQATDAGSAVGSAVGSGSAVAAPAPTPPTLDNPTETLGTLAKLYHSGAFFSLAIVVLFLGLGLADSKITYLQQGKRGVYIAAALGGLAMLAAPAFQGTTPNLSMFTSALATAVALVINPQKSGPAAS